MKKPTVTIGIPAYNEEANIAHLLTALSQQNHTGWELTRVIIYADGCTDATVEKVQAFAGLPIQLVNSPRRRGVCYAQNIMFQQANTDIVVLLNADILPQDKHLITRLVQSITSDASVGLVGGKVKAAEAQNYFESVMAYSTKLKLILYENARETNPIYLCHGAVRAYRKQFYKNFRFPRVIADDAYSYLECKRANFRFVYQDKAIVKNRCPATFMDQMKQTVRFYQGHKELEQYFGPETVAHAYKLPKHLVLSIAIRGLLANPLRLFFWAVVLLVGRVLYMGRMYNQTSTWEQVKSSKRIVA